MHTGSLSMANAAHQRRRVLVARPLHDDVRLAARRSRRIGSNLLHPHAIRVVGKRLEIVDIRSECGATGLRDSDDECIDGGTSTRLPAQQSGAPCQRFGNLLDDIARLEKAIRERVATRVALQALNEDD